MKYAIMNLPSTYYMKHSQSSGLYSVYCEGEMIGQSFSKDEVEWLVRNHYSKNSD